MLLLLGLYDLEYLKLDADKRILDRPQDPPEVRCIYPELIREIEGPHKLECWDERFSQGKLVEETASRFSREFGLIHTGDIRKLSRKEVCWRKPFEMGDANELMAPNHCTFRHLEDRR